jgi:hypothetical protein
VLLIRTFDSILFKNQQLFFSSLKLIRNPYFNGANATNALYLFLCRAHKKHLANATRDVKTSKVAIATYSDYRLT